MVTKLTHAFSVHDFDWRAGLTPEQIAEQEAEDAAREVERIAQEAIERRDRREIYLQRAGARLRDETHAALVRGKLDDTEALAAVSGWLAARKQPWLMLSGRAGCGKTVAAASAIADRGGLWLRSDDVVRSFSSMFGEQYEWQQKAKDSGLLVVDDLGAEVDAARMLPALLELIDARVSAQARPTICTTNLTKREFSERYQNERLNSRMRELVRWVSLSSGDLRGKCG